MVVEKLAFEVCPSLVVLLLSASFVVCFGFVLLLCCFQFTKLVSLQDIMVYVFPCVIFVGFASPTFLHFAICGVEHYFKAVRLKFNKISVSPLLLLY